jgi:hypothetical protein
MNKLTTLETTYVTFVVASAAKCWAGLTLSESQLNIFCNCILLESVARQARKFRLVRFLCNGNTFPFRFHRNVYIRCFLPFQSPFTADSRRLFCLHIPGTWPLALSL